MIDLIKKQNIKLMIATYFEKKTAQMIEAKTGIKALYLPLHVNAVQVSMIILSLSITL
jgi:hypothetical protein